MTTAEWIAVRDGIAAREARLVAALRHAKSCQTWSEGPGFADCEACDEILALLAEYDPKKETTP
jgi:hypothetical protein